MTTRPRACRRAGFAAALLTAAPAGGFPYPSPAEEPPAEPDSFPASSIHENGPDLPPHPSVQAFPAFPLSPSARIEPPDDVAADPVEGPVEIRRGTLRFRPAPDILAAPRHSPEIGFRWNLSHPDHMDRQGIAMAGTGLIDAIHQAVDAIGPEKGTARALTWAAVGVADWMALSMAHEYGHMSSHSRLGCIRYRIGIDGEPPSAWRRATPESVFKAFMITNDAFITVSPSDADRIARLLAGRPEDYLRYAASVEAGGVNQEQAVLGEYADRLLAGRFNPDDAVPYLVTALATATYPPSENNDLADYAEALAARGIGTNETRIRALSLARLLGGTAWAAARGFAEAAGDCGTGGVEPVRIARIGSAEVLWPEVAACLSEFGPTLQVGVPVMGETWSLHPAWQHVVAEGVSLGEAGLRVEKTLHPLLAVEGLAVVNTEAGGWIEAGVRIRPLSWLSLQAGYAFGHGYTIHRDVYGATPDYLEENESSVRLGVTARLTF